MKILDSLINSKNKIDCYAILNGVSLLWQIGGCFPLKIIRPIGFKKSIFSWFLQSYNILLFIVCTFVFFKGWYEWKEITGFVNIF